MKQAPDTETLSRLFLELSQFLPETFTRRELDQEKVRRAALNAVSKMMSSWGDQSSQQFQDLMLCHRILATNNPNGKWHDAVPHSNSYEPKNECPACKGDGDDTCGMSCETCGGTGKV